VGIYDGRVRAVDPTPRGDGLFRVLVEPAPGKTPWPDLRFVRQGGKVLGWIQGDTVTVGYELWRQLNDFPLNFGQEKSATGKTRRRAAPRPMAAARAQARARRRSDDASSPLPPAGAVRQPLPCARAGRNHPGCPARWRTRGHPGQSATPLLLDEVLALRPAPRPTSSLRSPAPGRPKGAR
jgi:hypothetical protein